MISTLLAIALCACVWIAIYTTVSDTRDWYQESRQGGAIGPADERLGKVPQHGDR